MVILETDLYRAQTACFVAEITPRSLDYWVTKGVIKPHAVYRGPEERRDFFLFSFRELLQLRIISTLRRAGLSPSRLRLAIDALRAQSGDAWHHSWLIAEATRVYVVHSPTTLEEIGTRSRAGQLAFAALAIDGASQAVTDRLARISPKPFVPGSRGKILPFVRDVA